MGGDRHHSQIEEEKFFFSLLRSGLWDIQVDYEPQEPVNWKAIYQMAVMQTVVPLIADGIDHYQGQKPEGMVLKAFIKEVFHTERRNVQINECIAKIFKLFKENNIKAYLVKGQGVARTYVNPLHRQPGDIDLLLLGDNYQKAKELLMSVCHNVGEEQTYLLHIPMMMDDIEIELHGTFNTITDKGLNRRIEKWMPGILSLPSPSWKIADADIPLASYNFDSIFIFLHFFRHYFEGGLGIRQICDWVRYLYSNQNNIDEVRLQDDIQTLGIKDGWDVFMSVAIKYLGFPSDIHSSSSRKSANVISYIMDGGNFGNYRIAEMRKSQNDVRKSDVFFFRMKVFWTHFFVFPKDTLKNLYGYISHSLIIRLK